MTAIEWAQFAGIAVGGAFRLFCLFERTRRLAAHDPRGRGGYRGTHRAQGEPELRRVHRVAGPRPERRGVRTVLRLRAGGEAGGPRGGAFGLDAERQLLEGALFQVVVQPPALHLAEDVVELRARHRLEDEALAAREP